MMIRIAAAVLPAAVVTSALLVAMQQSIATGTKAVDRHGFVRRVDVARIEHSEHVETRRLKPEKPPRPAVRPALVQATPGIDRTLSFRAAVTAPEFTTGAYGSRGDAVVGDSDYTPIVRALFYPEAAIARNLEGYVILEYTVTSNGKVRDISVVESTEPLLEASAIRSVLDFEYKPRVVGGEAVDVAGVVNKIVFTLVDPEPGPVPL